MFSNEENLELIEKYRLMVFKLATDIKSKSTIPLELEDLISYGITGLLESKSRFDPLKGSKFSTFAWYRIRGAIYDGIREHGNFGRSGLRAMERFNEYMSIKSEEKNIDISLEGSMSGLAQGIEAILVMKSLDDSINIASDDAVEENVERNQLIDMVRANVDSLPEPEKNVLKEYYFADKTLTEIGNERNRSKSWATRMHARAIDKIRKKMAKQLPAF
ncbi:MAG: sigma-70 family RNA polymerase sigma factor [Deltaproteobacteria bacterium]|nr:sigma-70 family RNA polymerase sigma factor [Deltaproteobacteria bacterium]